MQNKEDLTEQFFLSATSFQHSWKSHLFKLLKNEDISPAQIGILFFIEEKQPVSAKEIATKMLISPSAVAQLIDPLYLKKLIDKKEDAKDRRISFLSLSKKGQKKMKHIEKKRKELFVAMTAGLSQEELKSITAIQNKMLKQIEDYSL